ncbi:MbtH family protein [Saccharothrix australiensis]|uniref:MbtH protein n=1 Tax=Saccharothrix australiensis TaxID=2072 RepID=A0A495W2M0_9PSEU|nr:MbtH family NRPS accessory protein [Saccharothrix australiensis]RKT55886.1 MbtH protein [Saccharothrix australiensis]
MRSDIAYQVLVNDEGQYSLWPAHQPVPAGWVADGKTGTVDECSAHVDSVWTDMRPKSLRDAMSD